MGSTEVYRHGKEPSGEQRYRCYKANEPTVIDITVDMAMNGSGVRDTARVLGISPTKVMNHLKNSTRPK